MGRTIIGLDLGLPYAQVSYYNERLMEPETLGARENQNSCLIPVPDDLFALIEGDVGLGVTALANFVKSCIQGIRPAVEPESSCIMVTMELVNPKWADAIKEACQAVGFARENVFLQTYRESFCSYTLHQRRDMWMHNVALFSYENDTIVSYVMRIDAGTKPSLVHVDPGPYVELKRAGEEGAQLDQMRDSAFLRLIRETIQNEAFSAAFLIGDGFDKAWMKESLPALCHRRRVYQGRNLYTKGACYAAMRRVGVGKKLDEFLYFSEDTVEKNLGMQMEAVGKSGEYLLVSAGVNWFEAEHACEFLVSGTDELWIYAKSIHGGDLERYRIALKGLPIREDRTQRVRLQLKFLSRNRCKATVKDLGFGEFFPSTGRVWESILEV